MPCTSCFYGKWVEYVCTGQFGVFVYLVLRCIIIIIIIIIVYYAEAAQHTKKT